MFWENYPSHCLHYEDFLLSVGTVFVFSTNACSHFEYYSKSLLLPIGFSSKDLVIEFVQLSAFAVSH